MTRYLDRILKSDTAQALAARRLIYPGLRMDLRMSADGWRIRASGPMGAAEALLPRAGRSILPTLKALAEQVCINRYPAAGVAAPWPTESAALAASSGKAGRAALPLGIHPAADAERGEHHDIPA